MLEFSAGIPSHRSPRHSRCRRSTMPTSGTKTPETGFARMPMKIGNSTMVLRKCETKCSSWPIVGLRDELASVVLDNRAADRKAQAHAAGFRSVKRLKDRLQLLFLNANSVIFTSTRTPPDSERVTIVNSLGRSTTSTIASAAFKIRLRITCSAMRFTIFRHFSRIVSGIGGSGWWPCESKTSFRQGDTSFASLHVIGFARTNHSFSVIQRFLGKACATGVALSGRTVDLVKNAAFVI
jgi:hypothetical protein